MAFTPTNGNGWRKKSYTKGLQMFAADVVGNTADLLFLRYQGKFDNALPFVKTTFKAVMYTPLKIIQQPLEWGLNHLSGIEGAEAKEARLQQSPEKRLEDLLDTSYHYLSAAGVGYVALIGTEKYLSKWMHTGHVPNKMWTHLDIPVHVGAALFLGSHTAQPVTNNIKNVLKRTMVASGWSEEKAEQDSRFTIAYILPNYLTLIPTTWMMGSLYHAESKGLVRQVENTSWTQKITGGKFGDPTHGFEILSKDTSLKTAGGMTHAARFLKILGDPTSAKTASH